MAGLPPKIDNTDPGTPSDQWARSTTTAAFARSDPAPAMATSDPCAASPQRNPAHHDELEATTTRAQPSGLSISPAHQVNKGPFDANLLPPSAGEPVPGAYPSTPADLDPTGQTSTKGSAQQAAESSYAFVASAATTAASYLPRGVVDTVSSYMPTSHATSTMTTARASEHDVEHKTSLPSSEYSGAASHEHIGGVGALPGPKEEPGVVKLPDENTDSERYLTTGAAVGAATAAVTGGAYALKDTIVGSAPSTVQGKENAQQADQSTAQTAQGTAEHAKEATPGTKIHATAVTASTLPSHEPMGAQAGDHSLGVGALPGNQSEPHVALLPEESAHPQYDSGPIDTAAPVALKPSEEAKGNEASTGAARNVAGVGALVGDKGEEGVARLPEEREHASGIVTEPIAEGEEEDIGGPCAALPGGVAEVGAVVGGRDKEGKQNVHAMAPEGTAAASIGSSTGSGVEATQQQRSRREEDLKQERETRMPTTAAESKERDTAKEAAAGAAGVGGVAATGAAAQSGHKEMQTQSGDLGTGRLTSEHVEKRERKDPHEMQQNLLFANLRPRPHALGAERAQWGGTSIGGTHTREELEMDGEYGVQRSRDPKSEYHPAQLHPREAETHEPSIQAGEGESRPGEQQHPPHAGESRAQKERKATFIEKMKGEAKVLLGKLEGKQEKVDEGERLKHPKAEA